jgi:octaprenyl-diphosphate synthase
LFNRTAKRSATIQPPERIPMSTVDRQSVDKRRVDRPSNGHAALDLQGALAALYASIKPELRRVDARLHDELHSDHPEADAVIRHGIRLAGKRLRPALLLLAGQAVGELGDDHITLAAVAEMIHTATLVHDDVLDEAALRRHVDTVNARWNNETSVLLGDFLFTHAFYLASTLDSTYACRTIGRSTNIVCDGELRQTVTSGNVNLSEDDYLTIVESKTAELCACCCELGAHYAGGDAVAVARLSSFGRNLGIAFQIADDLLDLEGNESATGKSLGTDLAKCKMTLPLIHCRENLGPHERKTFLAALVADRATGRDALLASLARHDSLAYARTQAQLYADRAQAQLADLADSPAKSALSALAEFTIARRA